MEARDETNEDFGLKRLAQVVKENSGRWAKGIVVAPDQAIDTFVGRVPPHGDRTLIAVKMLEAPRA